MHIRSFMCQGHSVTYQSVDALYSDESEILHFVNQLEHGLVDLQQRLAGLAILDTASSLALRLPCVKLRKCLKL
jgi:hypothetical protein